MQQNIVCIYAQQRKEKKIQWNNGGYHFSQSSGPKWMDGVQCRKAPEQIRTYLVPQCTVAASRIQHEQAGNVAGKKARESDIFHQSLAHFSAHMNSGFFQIALNRISSVLTLQIQQKECHHCFQTISKLKVKVRKDILIFQHVKATIN